MTTTTENSEHSQRSSPQDQALALQVKEGMWHEKQSRVQSRNHQLAVWHANALKVHQAKRLQALQAGNLLLYNQMLKAGLDWKY